MIGSGPAGVACASALADRGVGPLVLDGGRTLEPERRTDHVAALRRSFPVDVDALPLKPSFGSLFAYAPQEANVVSREVGAVPSLAVGGLSTVWGAAMLPYPAVEHRDWPVDATALEPHYRAVLGFVPLAGDRDDLEERFPLYTQPQALDATAQVASLLADLRRNRERLLAGGVLAGRSRLAVHTGRCEYLGRCMLGCPRDAIYSSAETLAELVRDRGVHHAPGSYVTRLEEKPGHVVVHVRESEPLVAERVFVAAGSLSTTRIVLHTLGRFDQRIAFRDNAYFTFAALRFRRAAHANAATQGNTLAQAFLELEHPEVCSHPVHLQVYGFNDLMLRAVAARLRLPERVAGAVLQPLLGRLLYVQGFLHSEDSPTLSATLRRDGTLLVEPADGGPDVRTSAGQVIRTLRSLRRAVRFEPLSGTVTVWPAGKSFHVGGSLPMGRETDALGRPAGLRRVHAVDASVLPTLAATVTLPAMANAHRIGTYAGLD